MLKSRTEKGLHIPFIFFLISILPQLYLKDHPTWSSSFQDISFSTVPTPPSSFVYLGTQRVEASFRSCIPVTNSHFCCSYPLYIPIETPAHCQLKRLCEYIPILFWLCLQELDWIPVVRIPAFVLPVPVPEREWPFRRWVFMNTLSPGTDWCCRRCWESQLADCNSTAISTNFICKTKSKPRHSSNTIYKENSLSWTCNIQNQHHSYFWYLDTLFRLRLKSPFWRPSRQHLYVSIPATMVYSKPTSGAMKRSASALEGPPGWGDVPVCSHLGET